MSRIGRLATHELATKSRGARLLSAVLRRVGALVRAITHRREVASLLDLDDRVLKDLGLTRDDVRRALNEPLIVNPSTVLMVRSVERRSRLRSLAVPPGRVSRAALGAPLRTRRG